VENFSALLEAARSISTALTVVLALIACISLVVSGVGIMNIMLVTVTERTREIGIRKAIGARRTDILYQFLIEAILISGIGALLGVSGAAITTIVLQPLVTAYSVRIPLSSVSMALSFTVSCATGILFGYVPASRASKLLPIEALSHE
jgi:putative ABC transport system permease protein